jgi:hypothetical protein
MSAKTPDPDWSAVAMTPRARAHYEKFLQKYQRYLKRVNEIPLTALVWGPGTSGGDLYEKRLQIRGRLREVGVAAVFSEEIDSDSPVTDCSSKARELLQALSADMIVVVQSSPGSIAEAHDFAGFIKDLGPKMMIFIDKRAEHGYSYTGALAELKGHYGNVHCFEYPKDIEECHLTTSVLEKVSLLRHTKWRQAKVK